MGIEIPVKFCPSHPFVKLLHLSSFLLELIAFWESLLEFLKPLVLSWQLLLPKFLALWLAVFLWPSDEESLSELLFCWLVLLPSSSTSRVCTWLSGLNLFPWSHAISFWLSFLSLRKQTLLKPDDSAASFRCLVCIPPSFLAKGERSLAFLLASSRNLLLPALNQFVSNL